MATLSDEAAVLIRSLLENADLPETAGLRLGTDPERNSLEMRLVPQPAARDVVIAHRGASLFLSPVAARRLRGQTLRAQLQGRRAFFVD
ncbi:MAG: hypothetical protein WCD35_15410 [Mycobacteriales bacterium]